MSKMNTKTIAAIAIFASLTIVLNLSPLKIPAPYATYLIYQIWEIPIVAAFLLYGILVGFMIAFLNTLVLLAVFPGELPTGPLYNFAAVLSMLLGVLIAKKLAKLHSPKHEEAFLTTFFTIFGIITRVLIMSFVNYTFLRFPPPVGFNMPEEAIIVSLPLIAIFNGTLALYTIPLGYYVAKTAKMIIKSEE
jgi:riboflavin transporter FmnP